MSDKVEGNALLQVLADNLQEAGEQAVDTQQELIRHLLGAGDASDVSVPLGAVRQTATFKTRVQKSGRISIPDAEREALDIQEGDIVQTVIVPVKRDRGDSNE